MTPVDAMRVLKSDFKDVNVL